jgi:Raf kinase inhibitor-like YbhB/YbcL family protein
MIISSPAFGNNDVIPAKYTCDGEGVSPPFEFFDVPRDAVSLVLIVQDPDAPTGLFTHWTVWNIDPQLDGIGEGNLPKGAMEGSTSAGKPGYVPPCPPEGAHRYFFKLFGLTEYLTLPPATTPEQLMKAMEGKIVEHTHLMGIYERIPHEF